MITHLWSLHVKMWLVRIRSCSMWLKENNFLWLFLPSSALCQLLVPQQTHKCYQMCSVTFTLVSTCDVVLRAICHGIHRCSGEKSKEATDGCKRNITLKGRQKSSWSLPVCIFLVAACWCVLSGLNEGCDSNSQPILATFSAIMRA